MGVDRTPVVPVKVQNSNLDADRSFLRRDLLGGFTLLFTGAILGLPGCGRSGGGLKGLSCSDSEVLSDSEKRQRLSFDYVDVSLESSGRNCSQCLFFKLPANTNNCGRCVTVKGPIDGRGHCSLWTLRPQTS